MKEADKKMLCISMSNDQPPEAKVIATRARLTSITKRREQPTDMIAHSTTRPNKKLSLNFHQSGFSTDEE